MQGQKQVLVETGMRHGGLVATVTIDNPGRLNALNQALMTDFIAAFASLAANEALRAVVLTGAGGRAFVGGADINEMAALRTPDAGRAFITLVHGCCHAVRTLPVPVIAAISGYAFGAGLELAASCDLRIATDTAQFGMPEVKLGIPSVVEAALLPLLVGWGRARQMLLLGTTIGAAEALAIGLVERVVPPDGLDAGVDAWLAELMAGQPRAVRAQKALMRSWENLPLQEAVQAGIDCFARAFESDEPGMAMDAFLAAKALRKRGG